MVIVIVEVGLMIVDLFIHIHSNVNLVIILGFIFFLKNNKKVQQKKKNMKAVVKKRQEEPVLNAILMSIELTMGYRLKLTVNVI